MKPLTNAETRAMCSTCHEKRAWLGERECGDCLMETRLGLWLQSGHALPGGWAAPLVWASDGALPPRITEVATQPRHSATRDLRASLPREVPLPASQEAESMARRVTAWVGLLLLCAFTAGLLFGRFG